MSVLLLTICPRLFISLHGRSEEGTFITVQQQHMYTQVHVFMAKHIITFIQKIPQMKEITLSRRENINRTSSYWFKNSLMERRCKKKIFNTHKYDGHTEHKWAAVGGNDERKLHEQKNHYYSSSQYIFFDSSNTTLIGNTWTTIKWIYMWILLSKYIFQVPTNNLLQNVIRFKRDKRFKNLHYIVCCYVSTLHVRSSHPSYFLPCSVKKSPSTSPSWGSLRKINISISCPLPCV